LTSANTGDLVQGLVGGCKDWLHSQIERARRSVSGDSNPGGRDSVIGEGVTFVLDLGSGSVVPLAGRVLPTPCDSALWPSLDQRSLVGVSVKITRISSK
jgi:hypothetical protein